MFIKSINHLNEEILLELVEIRINRRKKNKHKNINLISI